MKPPYNPVPNIRWLIDSTLGTAKPRLFDGLQLYWYKVEISACESTTTVTQATLDAPFQDMTNLWSSTYLELASAYLFEDSIYKDLIIRGIWGDVLRFLEKRKSMVFNQLLT